MYVIKEYFCDLAFEFHAALVFVNINIAPIRMCYSGNCQVSVYPIEITKKNIQNAEILRDILKSMFSRFMLYRHNAAIGTD